MVFELGLAYWVIFCETWNEKSWKDSSGKRRASLKFERNRT